jgi:hypothetical protein
MNFEERVCEASTTQDEAILEGLRLESMFEFAEFYFGIRVMGFIEPDDITLLAKARYAAAARKLLARGPGRARPVQSGPVPGSADVARDDPQARRRMRGGGLSEPP